jgi:hypothetical protein
LRKELSDLIEGKTIVATIYENIVFNDITNPRSDLIWSFLLHSGYIKIVQSVENDLRQKYELQIPNREVLIVYIDLIEKWIKSHVDIDDVIEDVLNDAIKSNRRKTL